MNALWIDRIALQDSNDNVVRDWGANNLIGFCFSGTWSDGNNAWCWNNRAYAWFDFNR